MFKSILKPDQQDYVEFLRKNYQTQLDEFSKLTDNELAIQAETFLQHCDVPRHPKGSLVYDTVMYHVIIPELVKRVRSREELKK